MYMLQFNSMKQKLAKENFHPTTKTQHKNSLLKKVLNTLLITMGA